MTKILKLREKKFDVTITEAQATDISRQQLSELYVQIMNWEASLSNTQRENLNGGGHSNYTQARDSAYNAILSNVVQDYGVYYFSLMNEWENIRYDDLGDQFWMNREVNNAAAFEDSLIKSIGGWFSSFSGTNIDTGTFSFNMENFVNEFSQIFVVFVIVYIKLIIRSLELGMLSVVSPVFFACSVGEATMPYFKKFLTAFLSVSAEIIFMALVYMAFLWYCREVTMSGAIQLDELYNVSGTEAGKLYTYIAVSVACGIMMIKRNRPITPHQAKWKKPC